MDSCRLFHTPLQHAFLLHANKLKLRFFLVFSEPLPESLYLFFCLLLLVISLYVHYYWIFWYNPFFRVSLTTIFGLPHFIEPTFFFCVSSREWAVLQLFGLEGLQEVVQGLLVLHSCPKARVALMGVEPSVGGHGFPAFPWLAVALS